MRQIFASLFIAVAVVMLGVGIIAPILPLYADTFAATGVSIGLVFSAFSLSRCLLSPFIGRLSDRIGRKRILMIGLASYTLASVLYALAMSLWQLGIFRFVQGAAAAMVTPIAQAYIGDITPRGKEGRTMNLFYSSMFLGMALGPLLGGGLSALWSYELAFYAMGILSTVALVLVAATLPADHGRAGYGRSRPREIVPLRHVMKNDAVKAIAVYMATRGFWRQGFNTFYPLFAVAASGLGEASIGTVVSVYMLGGGLLQIPFGYLADRYPRLPQIVLGSTFAPLVLFAVPFVRHVWVIILITFAMGAFSALSRASIIAIRTELGRTHGMGTLAGLQGGSFAVGQMVGPLVSGVVADFLGVGAVFPVGGGIGLLGTGLVMVWLRRWRKRQVLAGN